MIQVEVLNFANQRNFGATFETRQEAEVWIAQQVAKGSWGKPLREVHEDSLNEFEKARVMSKDRDEADKWVCKVKADYEIRIYKASSYKEKRAAAYPSMNEVLEGLIENMEMRPQKLEQLKRHREAVRLKYPKDEKELLEIR